MSFKALTVNTPAASPAHILAEDDAALYAGIIGADCVLNEGSKMAASVISNNKVRVSDGVVMVEGHVGRILKGDYEDMTITNGVSGKKRNDLIVARFLAGSNGGADTFSLVVVKGAAGTTVVDPTVVKGNLYNGDKQRDLPLWRVKIEGLSIVKVEQLFEIGMTNKDLLNKCNELSSGLSQLNGNLGKIKYLGTAYTGESGGTKLTLPNVIPRNSMILILVRNYNGSTEVYPPYAFLAFVRPKGWNHINIGTPQNTEKLEIKDGLFSIYFKSTEYVRAWMYMVAQD